MAYTTIDNGGEYFNIKAYSGNNTGEYKSTEFQLDLLWLKCRNNARSHLLYDSTRGFGADKHLVPNTNVAEDGDVDGGQVDAGERGYIGVLGSGTTGFRTNSAPSGMLLVNGSSNTYVAWYWKANGGTTSSNTDGTNITSTVQANTTAGFSIVTWTGTGTISDTVGHGLGVKPHVVLAKERGGTDWWHMRHESLGSTENLFLNETNASRNATGGDYGGNIDGLTSSVFGFSTNSGGNAVAVNDNTVTNVAYCFTPIQGYSKFGSYTGNNNANGPYVYTGFAPAWVLVKRTDGGTNNWAMWDNKRGVNGNRQELYANLSNAEATDSAIDILSNGFKLRNSSTEWNNGDYIYMAFAEHPFVSSEGVPCTAR